MLRGWAVGLVAVFLFGAADPASGQKAASKKSAKAALPLLNEKILDFAKKKFGEQVGDGECWALANSAVVAAGGKSSPGYSDAPGEGDYVWGELVYGAANKNGKLVEETGAAKQAVLPGDVMQFRDAKFSGPRAGGGTYSLTAPHHTAVVSAVAPDGKTFQVLHQNWGGKRFVGEAVVAARDLREGWIKVYRPQPR
jgi:hypothetical protein